MRNAVPTRSRPTTCQLLAMRSCRNGNRALLFCHNQRRIFIFGALGYFKLGSLLKGSRRLMSYKLGLHVLATLTEQVVPIHNHITLFWIPSISGTETVIMKLTRKPAVKLSDNTPITYLLSSLCSCTVCKCQEFALNKAPVLLTTLNSLLLYISGAQTVARKALWSGPRSNFHCKVNLTL